jgi:Spy/CpxP family protein refolding chaperone
MKTVAQWKKLLGVAAAGAALVAGSAGVALAQPMGPHGHAMHGPGAMGMGGGRMGGAMLDAAGATADQRAKIQSIMKAARDELRAQHEGARALHQQMAQLLSAAQLDPAAIEATRAKIAAQHDAASKRMTQALLDAAAVLTPEQRQKIATQMAARRDTMERHRHEREALTPKNGT